jgi:CRP/FNR family transcriptional regulator, anaerobic regulatory protein
MASQFIKDIDKIYPLSEGLKEAIGIHSDIIEIPKKHMLLSEGQRSDYVYFVISGLLRMYYIKDGMEICSRFMHEQHIVISIPGFYTRKPAYEFIEALETCVLARIHYDKLQHLYKEFIEFNYIARVWTEHYCSMSEQRLFLLRKQSAEGRYLYFLENHPQLLQRIPLKYIATYLGMTLETLSRVRKKLSA